MSRTRWPGRGVPALAKGRMLMDKHAGKSLAQFLEAPAPAAAAPAMESGLTVTDGLPAPTGRERLRQN